MRIPAGSELGRRGELGGSGSKPVPASLARSCPRSFPPLALLASVRMTNGLRVARFGHADGVSARIARLSRDDGVGARVARLGRMTNELRVARFRRDDR